MFWGIQLTTAFNSYAISVMVALGSRRELRDIIEETDHASFIATSIHPQAKPTPGAGIKVSPYLQTGRTSHSLTRCR